MRVLALNVASCRDGIDRVAGLVRVVDPDVALLSEVARGQERAVAETIGGRVAVKGSAMRLKAFGNAILLREAPRAVRRVLFPRARGLERRGMVIATLSSGTAVAATHLGLNGVQRVSHARRALEVLERFEAVVLGGDLNEPPGGEAVTLLRRRFVDAFEAAGEGTGETFRADAPSRRIDYVMCTPNLTPSRAAVVPVVASDHLGVVAEIV